MPEGSNDPHDQREDATAIVRRLRENGHVAYFAGGCVRDMLLGLEPTDYDVATDAPPERVRALFSNTQAVGAAFGVILVRHGRSVIEVATFRTDVSYEDGRRPTAVRFTTAEEDAKRRDFTINGMFFDPVENRVIDYVGGQEDLKKKLLRAIGEAEQRFREDYLRLLRAVRFASRFSLEVELNTARAIKATAGHLVRISPERVGEEMRLMFAPITRLGAFSLLRHYGLMDYLFRFIDHRTESGPGHGTVAIFEHTAPQREIPFALALASASLAYLWPRAGGDDLRDLLTRAAINRISENFRKTLKISNDERDALESILSGCGVLLADEFPSVAALKRFLARTTSGASRELLKALAASGLFVERVGQLNPRLEQLEHTQVAPPPLLTGDDLTAVGYAPGPIFKRILDAVYDAQLEDRVATKEQALALARSL